ncbi:hypothetical protein AB0P36_07135 [Streptomyces flavidovirens]|uniref:hypothetical protein n=1 Tax=Streptomyces flavidovirens TaxID=67298 RepID=UPI00342E20EF
MLADRIMASEIDGWGIMGIFLGILSGLAGMGILWGSWLVARKGVELLQLARRLARGSATARAVCVGTTGRRHTYRFSTPDGVSRMAVVSQTGNLSSPKVGSKTLIRYQVDDPKTADRFVTEMVGLPLGGIMTLGLAVFCAAVAVGCGFLGYAAVVEL